VIGYFSLAEIQALLIFYGADGIGDNNNMCLLIKSFLGKQILKMYDTELMDISVRDV
jgi:hypothetical protein